MVEGMKGLACPRESKRVERYNDGRKQRPTLECIPPIRLNGPLRENLRQELAISEAARPNMQRCRSQCPNS